MRETGDNGSAQNETVGRGESAEDLWRRVLVYDATSDENSAMKSSVRQATEPHQWPGPRLKSFTA